MLGLALLGGCSGAAWRMGSPVPPGAQLTPGRVIEAEGCDFIVPSRERFKTAYARLRKAAAGDLITDVEVSEGANCTRLRARAVKVADPPGITPP